MQIQKCRNNQKISENSIFLYVVVLIVLICTIDKNWHAACMFCGYLIGKKTPDPLQNEEEEKNPDIC